MAAGIIIAASRLASGSTSNPGDPRASVLELEWRTPTGYERCAAVVTARRPTGLLATTAGHCAKTAFSVARFFDGYTLYGSAIQVAASSETYDAAALIVTVNAARVRSTPIAVPVRSPPALGTPLTIVGHPVAAIRGPNDGRWTVSYGRMGETVPNSETGALEYEVYCPRCGAGDSGSGVFDGEGRFVGMVYGVTAVENAAGGRLPDGLYANVIPAAVLR